MRSTEAEGVENNSVEYKTLLQWDQDFISKVQMKENIIYGLILTNASLHNVESQFSKAGIGGRSYDNSEAK